MNTKHLILLFLLPCMMIFSCEKNEVFESATYACDFPFPDSSSIHPKAGRYQAILDANRKKGITGAVVLIKDRHGLWAGGSGKADIASNIDVAPCNRFLIASISKVFTAAAVFRYIDEGKLSLDDPISTWVEPKLTNKLANADQASIRHLLRHTSGIPDYYTLSFQMDILNNVYNNWRHEETLTYAFGLPALHEVGASYYYSNTNFLLLGIILEKVSGLSLGEVYEEEIFKPLQLTSGYFGQGNPIPSDLVKGYADLYGNGQYVESEFLYKDELNTGDGGIAINAYDLAIFFERLMKGQLLSAESLSQMTDWQNLPDGWADPDLGHFQNGLGLQHNATPYGNSVGHTGSIYGFFYHCPIFPGSRCHYHRPDQQCYL